MADLTVSVTATLPGEFDETYTEVVHVSPNYKREDARQLFRITVENIGWHALKQAGQPTPIHDALLGGDARMLRLEELVETYRRLHPGDDGEDEESEEGVHPFIDRLRELFLVDAEEAIARWGDPQIEGQGDEDPSSDEDN